MLAAARELSVGTWAFTFFVSWSSERSCGAAGRDLGGRGGSLLFCVPERGKDPSGARLRARNGGVGRAAGRIGQQNCGAAG